MAVLVSSPSSVWAVWPGRLLLPQRRRRGPCRGRQEGGLTSWRERKGHQPPRLPAGSAVTLPRTAVHLGHPGYCCCYCCCFPLLFFDVVAWVCQTQPRGLPHPPHWEGLPRRKQSPLWAGRKSTTPVAGLGGCVPWRGPLSIVVVAAGGLDGRVGLGWGGWQGKKKMMMDGACHAGGRAWPRNKQPHTAARAT